MVKLGMDRRKIALGYNAVDHDAFARRAEAARRDPDGRKTTLSVLISWPRIDSSPRRTWSGWSRRSPATGPDAPTDHGWDLVLCGDGPGSGEVDRAIFGSGVALAIHRPGFLQAEEMAPWLAFASAFVHPSLMEPWGLVVNEAAACGLPLLVSDRSGCVETMVPDPPGTTGRRFDPLDDLELTAALAWMAGLPESERRGMGARAAEVAGRWGPERFAEGAVEALGFAGLLVGEPVRRASNSIEHHHGARS